MGVLTSLVAIDNSLFTELRQRRLLRRVAKVVHGQEAASAIGLPDDHVFPRLSLDKSWFEFDPLLASISPSRSSSFLVYQEKAIKRLPNFEASFWQVERVVWALANARAIRRRLGLSDVPRQQGQVVPYGPRGKEQLQVSLPSPEDFAAHMVDFERALMAHVESAELPDFPAPPSYYVHYLIKAMHFFYEAVRPAITGEDRALWALVRVSS